MEIDIGNAVMVVLGNQLFAPAEIADALGLPRVGDLTGMRVFMAEDVELCTYVKHHKQKITLFLAAMRSHADTLRDAGLDVHYDALHVDGRKNQKTYESKLDDFLKRHGKKKPETLVVFEIEDRWFRRRIEQFADDHGLGLRVLPSPMFLTPREEFAAYLEHAGIGPDDDGSKRPFMASFYQRQRKRLGVLLDSDGKPSGGKWSFDDENRKPLPRKVAIPPVAWPAVTDHVRDVAPIVEKHFEDHPGLLDLDRWPWPTTRHQAMAFFDQFLDERFGYFGDYEDALSNRSDTLFHSLLSPIINMGLITPREALDLALQAADASNGNVPLNSLEGFVRQIIGWREFIRGIDHHYGEQQAQGNRWDAKRSLTEHWWNATTGLPPLDNAIDKANRLGWTHHIERLMVLSNLMNLCEIEPRQVHGWFMAMYVDSSDWVMGPNVYGMGLMSDGGVFATKPYVCGSNYLIKMSDYTKKDATRPLAWLKEESKDNAEAGWGDVIDGLYWRFIEKHRDFFEGNPRMNMMPRALDKLKPERKSHIYTAAQAFLELRTT